MNYLLVRPGITDFASIIFSDEGSILQGHKDPDLAYNQLIRPGKSAFGLFYLEKKNSFVDICLIILTGISIFNRRKALMLTCKLLTFLNASFELQKLSLRREPLQPSAPPGSDKIVEKRH